MLAQGLFHIDVARIWRAQSREMYFMEATLFDEKYDERIEENDDQKRHRVDGR
ncbi:unnamed protein product [Paramecium octaurelia]|uniref:Uncharacterized protein n=1 Tax=Paramecium octaurelia TaxID=43137 RepID=A0A8S1WRB1_PAROT|nr:unnamed protein product [Paramecium octaurelia]